MECVSVLTCLTCKTGHNDYDDALRHVVGRFDARHEFVCVICSTQLNGPDPLRLHCASSKHKNRVMRYFPRTPTPAPVTPSPVAHVSVSSSSSSPAANPMVALVDGLIATCEFQLTELRVLRSTLS
jgi:hypothetical protein